MPNNILTKATIERFLAGDKSHSPEETGSLLAQLCKACVLLERATAFAKTRREGGPVSQFKL